MKKRSSLIIAAVMLAAFTGCGESTTAEKVNDRVQGVDEVLEAEIAKEEGESAESETESKSSEGRQAGINEGAPEPETAEGEELSLSSEEGIDIDLTSMSATMVYSEVYNMIVTPENYTGKIVKMRGTAASHHDEATDNYYYACIISDAAACCSQGIEYSLKEGGYPDDDKEISVVGTFDTYKEEDMIYCILRDAEIV
jgi:hypothetical protein